jgi:hypothetical protein
LILLLAVILVAGFILGVVSTKCFFKFKAPRLIGTDIITLKRNQAIEEARRQGKDTYEFEYSEPHPVLSPK